MYCIFQTVMRSYYHYFQNVIHLIQYYLFFDGCRRYKFEKEDLGIRTPADLLIRNRGVLSLLNPEWSYYLYMLPERSTYSIDSLCRKVKRCWGIYPKRRMSCVCKKKINIL